METQDIRILKILEKVQSENPPSQRDLARELNISLGLVNCFIKRLAMKGFVKATTIPRKRIKYILTQKGMTEKTRLTYKYVQQSYQFYRTSRQKLRRLFADLESQGVRRIVFFGASELAEIAFLSLQDTSIDLVAVVDERINIKKLVGRTVVHALQLQSLSFDRILITDERPHENILSHIRSKGVDAQKIVLLT